jgi:hypothetical protein
MKYHPIIGATVFVAFATIAGAATAAASSSVLSGNATADNQFTAYISTSDSVLGTQIGSGSNWPQSFSLSSVLTPNVTNYLHIVATNWSGPEGFVGSFSLSDTGFKFANGTQSLVTDTTNWRGVAIADAASWTTPTAATYLETYPWGIPAGINTSAKWIWSDPSNGTVAGLSTTISAVPLPAALPLFGSAIFGIAAFARRRAMIAA